MAREGRTILRRCCCGPRRIGITDPARRAPPDRIRMRAFLARALVLVFPCVAMAQIAVLQIKVVDGEGGRASDGRTSSCIP